LIRVQSIDQMKGHSPTEPQPECVKKKTYTGLSLWQLGLHNDAILKNALIIV
jgi:hypothetical protein